MSTPDLDRLEALAKAATPGPWHAGDRGIGWEVHAGRPGKRGCYERDADCRDLNSEYKDTFTQADASYIAAASPDVILGLIKELREAWARHGSSFQRECELDNEVFALRVQLKAAKSALKGKPS